MQTRNTLLYFLLKPVCVILNTYHIRWTGYSSGTWMRPSSSSTPSSPAPSLTSRFPPPPPHHHHHYHHHFIPLPPHRHRHSRFNCLLLTLLIQSNVEGSTNIVLLKCSVTPPVEWPRVEPHVLLLYYSLVAHS